MQKEGFRQIKRLIIALGISGALNIVLAASLAFIIFHEKHPTPYFELKPANKSAELNNISSYNNASTIRQLRKKSFNELSALLTSIKLVENGYSERDLALACLISFHHLDFNRALGGGVNALQRRQQAYGKRSDGSIAEITVYPALREAQWQEILSFVASERWPQSSHGLFLNLKKQNGDPDPSLADAFALTSEFQMIHALFARSKYHVERGELLQLLLDGDWQVLSDFCSKQRSLQDLSDNRRQEQLLAYVNKGSKTAAFLLLKTDLPFAVRKLDDASTLTLLGLLQEKSSDSMKFASLLLNSPRSDAVWKMAATRLNEYTGVNHDSHIRQPTACIALPSVSPKPTIKGIEKPQVIPEVVKVTAPAPVQVKKAPPFSGKDRLYLVQDGDNLWKISRRFNIDIELLKKHNRLTTNTLKPGTPLRIPVQS